METFLKIIGAVVAVVFLILLFAAVGAWFTQYLVNYLFTAALLTYLFGAAKISLTQAFALNIICGILFKSSTSTSSK